ncbi:MAG: hypothetical protein Q9227_003284 [Pyrenula ochraceoflavens]
MRSTKSATTKGGQVPQQPTPGPEKSATPPPATATSSAGQGEPSWSPSKSLAGDALPINHTEAAESDSSRAPAWQELDDTSQYSQFYLNNAFMDPANMGSDTDMFDMPTLGLSPLAPWPASVNFGGNPIDQQSHIGTSQPVLDPADNSGLVPNVAQLDHGAIPDLPQLTADEPTDQFTVPPPPRSSPVPPAEPKPFSPRPIEHHSGENPHCECYKSVLSSLEDSNRHIVRGTRCSIDTVLSQTQSAHQQATQVLKCSACLEQRLDLLLLVLLKIENTVGMLEGVSDFTGLPSRSVSFGSSFPTRPQSSTGRGWHGRGLGSESRVAYSGSQSRGSSLSDLMASRRLLIGAFEVHREDKVHFFKKLLSKRLRLLSAVLQQLQQRATKLPHHIVTHISSRLVSDNHQRLQAVIGRLEVWQG